MRQVMAERWRKLAGQKGEGEDRAERKGVNKVRGVTKTVDVVRGWGGEGGGVVLVLVLVWVWGAA